MPTFDFRCTICGKIWEQFLYKYNQLPNCCNQKAEKIWVQHSPAVIQDSIIGGQWIENLGHVPIRVDSKKQLQQEYKNRGLINYVKHVGVPGTDKSPHTSNWASIGKDTLEQTKQLLEAHAERNRPSTTKQKDPSVQITIRTRGKDDKWPARWESEYRGGPGKVVEGI